MSIKRHRNCTLRSEASQDFYNEMRAEKVAKTVPINPKTLKVTFEKLLKAGNDVLYLGSGNQAYSSSEKKDSFDIHSEKGGYFA